MKRVPKATPIIEYTEEGEEILNVFTCKTCDFITYNEVYDYCPNCLLKINYTHTPSTKD
jgi:rubrerythrin